MNSLRNTLLLISCLLMSGSVCGMDPQEQDITQQVAPGRYGHEECPICHEDYHEFVQGQSPIVFPCGHWTCSTCLIMTVCPLCRAELLVTPLHQAVVHGNAYEVEALIVSGAVVNTTNENGFTPLHAAMGGDAAEGNATMVEILVRAGADVNASDKNGYTPLYWAAMLGNPAVIKILIDAGANVNALDKKNKTPLYVAVDRGKAEIVSMLCEEGASVNAASENSETPLHVAVRKNDEKVAAILIGAEAAMDAMHHDDKILLRNAMLHGYEGIVTMLLKVSRNLKNNGGRNGCTLLRWAAITSNEEAVKMLLEQGANVNATSGDGNTPLHGAVSVAGLFVEATKAARIVEMLIKAGADVNIPIRTTGNRNGYTPLHCAVSEGFSDKEIVRILLEAGAKSAAAENGETPLHIAINRGSEEIVSMLCEAGVDLNAVDNNGDTPLHVAIRENAEDEAEILIKSGANVNAANKNGETPLYIAVQKHNAETVSEAGVEEDATDKDAETPPAIINMLLAAGANVNAATSSGMTPLNLAALCDKANMAEMLRKVANVTARNDKTLPYDDAVEELFLAIKNGDNNGVKKLLEASVDLNTTHQIVNLNGTPLHIAVQNECTEIVKLLLAAGAAVNSADYDYLARTPLHMAARKGHAEMVEVLIKNGANVNTLDKCGKTPLCAAVEGGNVEIVKMLCEVADVDVNVSGDNCYYTPLKVARRRHYTDIAEMLCQAGASDESEEQCVVQ